METLLAPAIVLPDGYVLVRKDLKHARLRVSEDGTVRVILPFEFTQEDVDAMLKKKARWLQKSLRFFQQKTRITLSRNQLLLFGKRYHYYYDATSARKIVVNHDHLTIQAKRDLLDKKGQEARYKGLAKRHLHARTEELATALHFTYRSVFVRGQRTKWGNCSAEGNISLNWRLIKAPTFVIDYLIIHELVHTRVMNHTSKFWTLLKLYCPDYRGAIEWLDSYGNSL